MIWTLRSQTLETLIHHPLTMTFVSTYVQEFHRYRYGRSVNRRNRYAAVMDRGGSWLQCSLLVDMYPLYETLEQTLQRQTGIPYHLLNISDYHIPCGSFIRRPEKHETGGGKNG